MFKYVILSGCTACFEGLRNITDKKVQLEDKTLHSTLQTLDCVILRALTVFSISYVPQVFFIVAYLPRHHRPMSVPAYTSSSSSFSQPDTTTTSIDSYKRSPYNHSAVNEIWISTNSLRTPKCSLIILAFENVSNYMQQHNCIIPLNETEGHRHFQAYALSKTREAAFNIAAHFVGNFYTNSSDSVLKHLHKCMEALNQQTLLNTSNEPLGFIHNISIDNSQAKSCIRTMDGMKSYVEVLDNIVTLALNISILESLNTKVQNISTLFINTRKYDMGEMALQYFDKYLTRLESMVQHIEELNKTLKLYNLSVTFDSSWVQHPLTFGKWESEWLKAKHRQREVYDLFMKVKVLEVFRRYVDPAVYCVIFTVGIVWNGVLLFIFVRHRQFWTTSNVMIFNVAVGDVLSIVLNVPVFYFAHYHVQVFQINKYVCKFYITLRPFSIALSALTVVGLSILRFGATRTPFNSRVRCEVSNRARTLLCILVVWVLAIVLALPYSFVLKFTAGMCFTYGDGYTAKVVVLSEFMFYCVALPCLMICFNVLTAKRLRDSARNMPFAVQGRGQDLIRNRSARVLTVLIAVFIVSYIPHHLWRVVFRWLALDIWEVPYRCIDKITYYMLFANCCFNPISLYGVSGRFRKLFNYYFLYLYNHRCKKTSDSHLQNLSGLFVTDSAREQTKF